MNSSSYNPAIIIPGMFQSMLVTGSPDGGTSLAWPPDIDGDAVMKDFKSSLIKMMMFRRDMGFSDKIASLASDICEKLSYKPDGQPKYDLHAVTYEKSYAECDEKERSFIGKMFPVKDLTDIIGGEKVWYFAYNFLDSPFECARKLRGFTELVKEKTGCDKVNFITLSLGAPVLNAYLSEFADRADTGRAVYFFAAANGTPLVSDIVGNTLNTDGILSVADILGGKNTSEFASMAKIMPDGVLESAVMKSLGVMREKVSMNSPYVWSLVPPAAYGELSSRLLERQSHSVLKEETDRYAAMLASLPEKLLALSEGGTRFYFTAGYGRHLLALCRNEAVSSDTIVDTASATFGTLTEERENAVKRCSDASHKHTTPDGSTDASYALFPESTWLFFEQKHAAASHNEDALEVAVRALSDDTFTDIRSIPELPQYGFSSDNRETISTE